jgi:hypothetical protein
VETQQRQPLQGNSTITTGDPMFSMPSASLSNSNNIGIVGRGVIYTSVQRLYLETRNTAKSVSRVEAGSNTSTVALRVAGGDENGSLESETVKYGRDYDGTRTRE